MVLSFLLNDKDPHYKVWLQVTELEIKVKNYVFNKLGTLLTLTWLTTEHLLESLIFILLIF